jgi:hypothetical protein
MLWSQWVARAACGIQQAISFAGEVLRSSFFVRGTAGGAYHTQAIGAKRTDDPCVETALTGWAIFDQR